MVEIEGMGQAEDEPGKLVVQAVIWVERTGQKAIVIGKGGELLKEIGRAARLDLKHALRPPGAPRAVGQGQRGLVGRRERAAQVRVRDVSGTARRVQLEPAFLLHHYPWRDTSRILELLTRGARPRLGVRARGARSRARRCRPRCSRSRSCSSRGAARGEAGQLTGGRARAAAGARSRAIA